MAHSLFSPSGAHRWAGCPGSIVLAGTEPEETGSSASREGTFLHEVMQKHVQRRVPFDKFPLDDEQRAVVTACAEYVESLPRDYALFETKVNFGKMLMQPETDTFGTADLVLVNFPLSPGQERNLEKLLQRRVLDRTGLILDIFAQRARSHEGKLQVELAQ